MNHLSKAINLFADISQEDKEFLYHHLRAFIAHSVHDDLQDEFEVYEE